jgi:hypothetical protein
MWKQATQVNQHFNDIEWRIRGLALTVATFSIGAAGVAARDGSTVWHFSLGTLLLLVGLLLWYAFYFVDHAWYHQLLRASVRQTEALEQEIAKSLPLAGLAEAITAGSPYVPSRLVRFLRCGSKAMHSTDKLQWFYGVGAAALLLVAVGLQIYTLLLQPTPEQPPTVVVHVDRGARQ